MGYDNEQSDQGYHNWNNSYYFLSYRKIKKKFFAKI
jgi:hypothetical protein